MNLKRTVPIINPRGREPMGIPTYCLSDLKVGYIGLA